MCKKNENQISAMQSLDVDKMKEDLYEITGMRVESPSMEEILKNATKL